MLRRHVLEFQSDAVTARRIEAGSRILAVPRQPDIQINFGAGRDVSDESIADAGEPRHLRLLAGSWLELRVRR